MRRNNTTFFRRKGPVVAPAALWLSLWLALPAHAQNAARGAELYMRLLPDTRSCLSCHGHDPSANPNNILKGADNSDAIVKALNTVSVMGFLRPELSDADTRDLAAYLGAVARASDPAAPLRVWPITFELGKVMVGGASAVQSLHLENRSTQAAELSSIAVTNPAFGLTHNCPARLAPASRCSVQLSMIAAPSGVQRSALVVSDARGTVSIAGLLSDGIVAPVSPIEWEGRASALNFPVATSGVAQTRTLAIRNMGSMPVTLGATTVTGPAAHQFERAQGCDAGTVLQAGTSCQMVWRYTASSLPLARATAQLRSDGGNPASLDLAGEGAAALAVPEPAVLPAAGGGGGCSIGPPSSRHADPVLLLLAALAGLAALGRRVRPPHQSR